MASSAAAGTLGRTARTLGGGSLSLLATIAWAVGPAQGDSPASISYSTAASEYWSLRASSARSPAACSGLIYAGVPTAKPVWVSPSSPASARAMPKSATSVLPSVVSRMFSGLMSRWTTPCWWA